MPSHDNVPRDRNHPVRRFRSEAAALKSSAIWRAGGSRPRGNPSDYAGYRTSADLLLMDERKGTEAARSLGLATVAVFGVLLEAKRRGLIDRVLARVDRLIAELRFFASPALRRRLAILADESAEENK